LQALFLIQQRCRSFFRHDRIVECFS
jgi:hypothetical protein